MREPERARRQEVESTEGRRWSGGEVVECRRRPHRGQRVLQRQGRQIGRLGRRVPETGMVLVLLHRVGVPRAGAGLPEMIDGDGCGRGPRGYRVPRDFTKREGCEESSSTSELIFIEMEEL